MNENPLNITALNDFIFCPVSIYFHNLYGDMERNLYQNTDQINGTDAHKSVDEKSYSKSGYIQSLEVYCEQYNLIGKIDVYDKSKCTLIERKKKVKTIYDGYVFQIYAQCFAMREMGYEVKKLIIRSIDDNKNYNILLPEDDEETFDKFIKTIDAVNSFDFFSFVQTNPEKCGRCIYYSYCDRGLQNDER